MGGVNRHSVAVLALTLLLAACSNLKTYPDDLPKNVRIQTKTSSGSIFQKVTAGLNIYEVDGRCQPLYLGTVELDRPVVEVGLPLQKPVYLEFTFDKSARLYNASSSINYGTLLHARPGRLYVVEASYVDDLYQVKMREKGAASNLERRPLASCKATR